MNNYTPYHIHTMLSNGITNIDSISFKFYDVHNKFFILNLETYEI